MLDISKLKDKGLEKKYLKLIEIIKSYKSVIVAFSGGTDSTLLAVISHNILAQKSLSITINSDFFTENELDETKKLAQKFNLNHKTITVDLFKNPEIIANDPLRCKYCKTFIFENLFGIAQKQGYNHVLDGSNIDDLKDYRPGFEASKALGVKSPFIEAGITKEEIRILSRLTGLPNWNKPALACVASRIPYHTVITKDIIQQIKEAESYIKNLGYNGFRVRHHDKIARIELATKDIEEFISKHRDIVDLKLKELGYSYVSLDLKGYQTGSLNTVIDN